MPGLTAMRPGTGGGSAAAALASDYQARCAAWFLGHLLAGSAAPPSIDLWAGPLVRVDCETNDAVDDIRVTAATGPRVVLQCKHTITMEVSHTG